MAKKKKSLAESMAEARARRKKAMEKIDLRLAKEGDEAARVRVSEAAKARGETVDIPKPKARSTKPQAGLMKKAGSLLEKVDPDTGKRFTLNPHMVCPHCTAKGQVYTLQFKQKRGISGGKATGAVLTAGTSMLFTGLSRKEQVTKAKCFKCNNTWIF
jgi:hypothetical protein